MLNAVYNVFIDELGLQRFYGKLFFLQRGSVIAFCTLKQETHQEMR